MIDLKNLKRSASRSYELDYPVELVWRAMTGSGKKNIVQPMEEVDWENKIPQKGEIFTRHLKAETNSLLSFQIKTAFSVITWRIELEKLTSVSTKVNFNVEMSYYGENARRNMFFAASPKAELKGFVANIKYNLRSDDLERKRRVEEFNIRKH